MQYFFQYKLLMIKKITMQLTAAFMLVLLLACNTVVIEPPDIPTIELTRGYSVQLPASPNVQWESEDPTVATVSSTGLVTALKAGKTTINSYSPAGIKDIVCYLEVFPKRNILMYIATDNNQLDNGSTGDEPKMQLEEICHAWKPGSGELLIYTDQTKRLPCLMRINETLQADRAYGVDTIQVYNEENSASAAVLSRVINTMVSMYPADSYGMLFFSHASGWLPEGLLNSPRSLVIDRGDGTIREMEYTDFAAAIHDKQFDFMIFDACFMADVIAMYELRNKTAYVLASSAEIVSPGFTSIYRKEIMRLFETKNTVESVVSEFGQSYMDFIKTTYPENNVYCSATMSLIKMSEMEQLASTFKTLLNGRPFDESTFTVNDIQRFDRPNKLINSGQRRNRFFDSGHAMEKLLTPSQYTAFDVQMKKTIVWKDNTKRFLLPNYQNGEPDYSRYDGYLIEHHSGLSTYIKQSVYPVINTAFENSSWYKAIR